LIFIWSNCTEESEAELYIAEYLSISHLDMMMELFLLPARKKT
jgi:hypothetical protein